MTFCAFQIVRPGDESMNNSGSAPERESARLVPRTKTFCVFYLSPALLFCPAPSVLCLCMSGAVRDLCYERMRFARGRRAKTHNERVIGREQSMGELCERIPFHAVNLHQL